MSTQQTLWSLFEARPAREVRGRGSDKDFQRDIIGTQIGQFPATPLASHKVSYDPKGVSEAVKDPRSNPNHPSFRAYEMAQFLMKDRVPKEKSQTIAAQRIRAWREKNPEKARRRSLVDVHRHRARVAGSSGGDLTFEEFAELCEKYGQRCLCCGEDEPLTVDHIIPISLGGSNSITNIQPLCHTCNMVKGDDEIDFRPGAESEYSRGFQARMSEQKEINSATLSDGGSL